MPNLWRRGHAHGHRRIGRAADERLWSQQAGPGGPGSPAGGAAWHRVGDARHAVPDVSRLKATGWEAQSGLEAMAREYWQWLQAQPNLDTYFEGADHLMERTGTVRVAR